MELYLDEEENLSLEGSDPEDNRIDGDENNTIAQRRLGLDMDGCPNHPFVLSLLM